MMIKSQINLKKGKNKIIDIDQRVYGSRQGVGLQSILFLSFLLIKLKLSMHPYQ